MNVDDPLATWSYGVLPLPGDMMVARRPMRAWENDRERGHNGLNVDKGDAGVLVQRWTEGAQIRLRILVKDQLVLFSHREHTVWLNWAYG